MKFLDNTGLSYLWGKIKSFVNNHTTVATCSTVADTSAKVVTINDSSWSLQKGCIIGVKFTNTNTATNVTLNVNNTGAKSIYYNASVYTSTSGDVCGTANRTIYYMYDGTYWVWISSGRDANDDNKTAQTVTTTNADYEVLFSGTADNTTRTEQARKNSNLKFNPSTGNLQATQLNGKTIGSDPKFTDTTYSDATTSESGLMSASDKTKLNGIAEGATANTGTVTSVATGAGLTGGTVTTSGTIKVDLVSETKLNNASTTSTESADRVYPVALDKNGKLAVNVPWTDNNTDTKVVQTATTTSANYEVLFSGTADNTTRTEGARKNSNLLFNPSTGNLQATQLNGVNIGSSPKFTDTTYSDATTSTAGLMSASDKTKLNGIATGATANTGTVTKVSTGAGLTGGDITTSGTIKANLKSETQSTLTASSKGSTANREYAVGLDANGNLSVNVPWTDTNVTQTATTINANYELLFSATADNTTRTEGVRKDSGLTFNPSTDTLATKYVSNKAIKALTGTGTAGSDAGSGVSPRYTPSLWTFNSGLTVANGEVYFIKIPVGGGTYGVWLSLNNGTNYYPVAVSSGKARFTTQYAKDTVIAVTYESASACTCYPKAGGDSTSDVTGCFRVLNDYDTNTIYSPVSLGFGYATDSRSSATTAVTATLSSYSLVKGGIVTVKFSYDVPANATLNVNSKGAKAIYNRGTAIIANIIKANDRATFMYDGSYYHLISIDYASKSAVSSGTELSLVTTGEKYTWNSKANTASPTFTGTPKAPTATAGTNTTQIATTAFVQTAVSNAMTWNYGL